MRLQRVLRTLLAGGVALATLSGCTLSRLNEQTREYDAATVLVGRVELGAEADGAIVVGAYARDGASWTVAHQVLLHEHGGYELIVPRGDYVVQAFADRNGNGLFDDGEPAASHAGGKPVPARDVGMVAGIDLVLGDGTRGVPRVARAPRRSTQAGALARLDAPELAAEQGVAGYWTPMTFFREHGGNVLFLEPYDPARVPVLFVHGAVGSAQDWRHQLAQLDRTRFQAWLFVYPSGAAVESMSNLLFWKLLNLQSRHRYERLIIVAHSMGGLVVRRFLLDSGASLPQVRRFISLSTPWGGEPSADTGVRYAPAVVPSWRDMQPEGPFMQALFARPLPPGVTYDLLFGHRGAPGLWRPNNDGTVTLASQLRRDAQQEAQHVFGFDEDHVSILSSPLVTRQLHALLLADDARGSGGRIDVRVEMAQGRPQGIPLLMLQPETGGTALMVPLAAGEGGGRVSAVPPGRYRAALLADGFAAEPRWQAVDVVASGVELASFRLYPSGTLSGYVGDETRRPAAGGLHGAAALRIRRVAIRGPGVASVLVPRGEADADAGYRDVLEGRDAAWGGTFVFIGLPAGEYTLEIEADGRPPHVSHHRVVPGQPGQVSPILMARPRP